MLNVFCSPARYDQGRDATRRLAEELTRLSLCGPALIIAGPLARSQVEATIRESFAQQGIVFELVEFGGECSTAEIARCRAEGARLGAKMVIGFGGGKALDTAKAAAALLDVPAISCPTVAASDAPCSALSVVYTPDGVFERIIFHKRNPELVLVDTDVIARAPVRYLISGMGDALSTWFEADTAHRAHKSNTVGGGSTLTAMAIARLCYETLLADGVAAVAAARRGAVTPALERIVEANTLLSGLGFESGGLCVAHAVHNGLTAVPQTHRYLHGEKVAFGTLVQLVLEGRPRAEIAQVIDFCRSVGLPTCLHDLGIEQPSPEMMRAVAERAVSPGESSHNEPFPVTWEAIRDAIAAADELGRQASVTADERIPA